MKAVIMLNFGLHNSCRWKEYQLLTLLAMGNQWQSSVCLKHILQCAAACYSKNESASVSSLGLI
jgi:hypothetical protein